MGFFSLMQELAIDLGTANTLIIYNGKVVVDEPSIIALELQTGKVKAIGTEAKKMDGRVNPNIKTIRPLKDGVIADFEVAHNMLRYFIKRACQSRSIRGPRILIAHPSGITEVDVVSLVPRLNGRYSKGDFMLIIQTIRGVVKTSIIDRILWSKLDSKFISPFLQIICRRRPIYIFFFFSMFFTINIGANVFT